MSEAGQCESLGVLGDVAAAYQQRLRLLARAAAGDRLQKQVEVLQSWVKDLSDQNALLARTVEELETEFTSRLLLERRRHSEWDKNKKICDKVNEMKMLNDSLIKENLSKDREIRKLNKDMQHCEQTVMSLRNEMSNNNYRTSEVSKKDVEVTADICCSGSQECGDAEPVRDGALCGARLQRMDVSLKSSGDSVRSLRQLNVSLSEEVRALQRVCGALDEQCRAAGLRARFKDDVIHEMRRQLRQAKAKLKELSESNINKSQKEHDAAHKSGSYDSLTIACVQRPRGMTARELEHGCHCRGSVYDESDDDYAIGEVCINSRAESFFARTPSPRPELSDGSQQTSHDREVPMKGITLVDGKGMNPESLIIDSNSQIRQQPAQ